MRTNVRLGSYGLACLVSLFCVCSASIAQANTQKNEVIRSRALVKISTDSINRNDLSSLFNVGTNASGSQPVTVILQPNTNFILDASEFFLPEITNDMLDLGFLKVTALFDNNLKKCGSGGNEKCSQAIIRTFTTGAAGPGLWNSEDGYGAPLWAGLENHDQALVGLGSENALNLQSISIDGNRHTVKLADFPTEKYHYSANFTDAGTGSFSTTIVVEYVLSN